MLLNTGVGQYKVPDEQLSCLQVSKVEEVPDAQRLLQDGQ